MATASSCHAAGPDRRAARRHSAERRTRAHLRDLCDEVLASYRVATDRDPLTEADRREAQALLTSLGVPTRR
ncbi:MAG: hypothetical protein ACJ79S_10795 [Gemmatimonadaceae bacterium]